MSIPTHGPVVIIGAARSGTNMLRDGLTQLPGFGTWPCDEINYIWRHGNRSHPDDELSADHATADVKRYVRRRFEDIARQTGASTIVEKTCANSLRVEFVDAVLPEARYVAIFRDGRDVVASAAKRWQAPFEPGYVLAKARYVPASDVPYYALRYALNRLHRLFSRDKRLAMWGPRFKNIDEALQTHSLMEVAAMQWAWSVNRSLDAFDKMDASRVARVRYEEIVSNPVGEFGRIAYFLDVDPEDRLKQYVSGISASSVGNWKRDLDSDTVDEIMPHLEPMLTRLGYA